MGVHNLKQESEFIQLQNIVPFYSPIKTEPDHTAWGSIVSQAAQILAAGALTRATLPQGQAFTQAAFAGPAPEAGTEAASAEDVRKLSARMDDLEARMAKF
jgi:hypothetical protein